MWEFYLLYCSEMETQIISIFFVNLRWRDIHCQTVRLTCSCCMFRIYIGRYLDIIKSNISLSGNCLIGVHVLHACLACCSCFHYSIRKAADTVPACMHACSLYKELEVAVISSTICNESNQEVLRFLHLVRVLYILFMLVCSSLPESQVWSLKGLLLIVLILRPRQTTSSRSFSLMRSHKLNL